MRATGTYDISSLSVVSTGSLGANAAVAPTFPIYGWETGGGTTTRYGGVTYSGALTGSVDVFPADFVPTTRSAFMGIHQA